MNGRRVSLMQDCTLDKKPQAYNLNGHGDPPGTVVATIKSSEFNKLDQTRSWLSQSSQKQPIRVPLSSSTGQAFLK